MRSKNKSFIRRALRLLLLLGGGMGLIVLIFFFVDDSLNGLVVDWLAKNYLGYVIDPVSGITYETPIWYSVKRLVLFLLLANFAFWFVVIVIVSRRAETVKAREISAAVGEYMSTEKPVSELFSGGDADIGAQLAEAKAQASRSEQLLREETARKNDLVMYLAHDLKTPLSSVIGYLTLLRDEEDISPELRKKYLSVSLNKAERLEDLINEFFEITRFNLSDITLEYGRIDLRRLLEQLVFEFMPMLGEKNMSAALDAPPELPISCDANKIQRVFDNLLRNAVLYGYPSTEIKISAVQSGGSVSVSFRNRGADIPPEKLRRIFEQFYRLDAARSSSGGAGLGLAVAKHIVQLHGGDISARSENETVEFTVTLPVGKS